MGKGKKATYAAEKKANKAAAAALLLNDEGVRHVFYVDLDSFIRPDKAAGAARSIWNVVEGPDEVRLATVHLMNDLRPFWLAGGLGAHCCCCPCDMHCSWCRKSVHRCREKSVAGKRSVL